MRRLVPRLVAALGMFVASIASAQARADIAPSRTVEEGIEILRHRADVRAAAPQFVAVDPPFATYGGTDADPAFDLTWLSQALILRDGRVVTFSAIGAKLLVFAATGTPERVIGRLGKGPGEFMAPGNVAAARGDTLVVVDAANNRINWIHADRGFVAERSLAADFPRVLGGVAGVLRRGDIVMTGFGRISRGSADGMTRSLAQVGIVNPGSGAARIIAEVPDMLGAPFETRFRGRRAVSWHRVRLGDHGAGVTWDSLIVTSDGSGTLTLRAPSEAVVRRIELPAARRPVTAAMRRAVVDRELAELRRPGSEGLVDRVESERVAREAPIADSLPVVGNLLVASDGTLWMVDPVAPGDVGWTATALTPSGAVRRRVRGTGDYPMAFGADRVLVRREDADGVVFLTAHRLAPARR